jgi:hypothetical protein
MQKLRIPHRTALAQRALELACVELTKGKCKRFWLTEREFLFSKDHEEPQNIFCYARSFMSTDLMAEQPPVRAKVLVYGGDAFCECHPADITVWIDISTPRSGPTFLKGRYNYVPETDELLPSNQPIEDCPGDKIKFPW